MSTTDLDDDDRALSGITSTTASHFRPSSIATTATIVHIQGQQHQQQQAPSPVRQVKKNHVIFYDSLAPSYHTVIKVTNIGKYKKETNKIYGTINKCYSSIPIWEYILSRLSFLVCFVFMFLTKFIFIHFLFYYFPCLQTFLCMIICSFRMPNLYARNETFSLTIHLNTSRWCCIFILSHIRSTKMVGMCIQSFKNNQQNKINRNIR